jgi:hypothetical protein
MVDDFGDDRIDLARHDRAAALHRRQYARPGTSRQPSRSCSVRGATSGREALTPNGDRPSWPFLHLAPLTFTRLTDIIPLYQ